MSKHTPAPWGFGSIDDTHIGICTTDKDGNWLHLADVDDLSECEINVPDADVRMANARLMIAAPDLLAALEEVVRISDRKHDAWDAAHAAITKAKGCATTVQETERPEPPVMPPTKSMKFQWFAKAKGENHD